MMKLHNFSLGNTFINISKVNFCLLYLNIQLSHLAFFLYMNEIVLAPEQLNFKSRTRCQWSVQLTIPHENRFL